MGGMDVRKPPGGEKTIGLLRESSLHAAMKDYLSRPLDRFEERVGKHVIDIVREDGLVEIQTANFSKLRPKLAALLAMHPIRIVFPVAAEKWIVHVDRTGKELKRRRSPRKGRMEDLLTELTQIISFVADPNLSVEAILVSAEEIRHDDGKGSWRRKGVSIVDRRLVDVLGRTLFAGPSDYLRFLPPDLPERFTNSELSRIAGKNRRDAQTITYCLRRLGLLEACGKRGREIEYRRIAGKRRTARRGSGK